MVAKKDIAMQCKGSLKGEYLFDDLIFCGCVGICREDKGEGGVQLVNGASDSFITVSLALL